MISSALLAQKAPLDVALVTWIGLLLSLLYLHESHGERGCMQLHRDSKRTFEVPEVFGAADLDMETSWCLTTSPTDEGVMTSTSTHLPSECESFDVQNLESLYNCLHATFFPQKIRTRPCPCKPCHAVGV